MPTDTDTAIEQTPAIAPTKPQISKRCTPGPVFCSLLLPDHYFEGPPPASSIRSWIVLTRSDHRVLLVSSITQSAITVSSTEDDYCNLAPEITVNELPVYRPRLKTSKFALTMSMSWESPVLVPKFLRPYPKHGLGRYELVAPSTYGELEQSLILPRRGPPGCHGNDSGPSMRTTGLQNVEKISRGHCIENDGP